MFSEQSSKSLSKINAFWKNRQVDKHQTKEEQDKKRGVPERPQEGFGCEKHEKP